MLHNATIALGDGSHAGWFGFYASADSEVSVEATRSLRLQPRLSSELGNAPTSETDPDPTLQAYSQHVREPHLFAEVSGLLAYRGPAAVKVDGLDLRIVSDENDTVERTGIQRDAAPVGTRTERWVFLEAADLVWTSQLPAPVAVAYSAMRVAWQGKADCRAAVGALDTGGRSYSARDEDVMLRGDLTATLTPVRTAGAAQLDAVVEGDLAASAIGMAAPISPSREGAALRWWLVGVAGVLMGATATLVAVRRPRGSRGVQAPSADECATLAMQALEDKDYASAAEWLARARRLAPSSGRLASDHAYALSQIGDVGGALAAYAAASALSDDGQADFDAARLLVETGGSIEAALSRFGRALERSPWLALEAVEDPEVWSRLGQRGEELVRVALRRVDTDTR